MPTITELIQALPERTDKANDLAPTAGPLAEASLRPLPVGRWRRMGLLGTLQAQIAAAYMFYWVRSWFQTADAQQRALAEAHWRTALRLLDSMGYLRGAIMKVGQTMANLPNIAPREFVETLDQLHYDAPPMHWSLLREMVFNELGDDPENLFASFEKRGFAAASLGQVHGARLPSGERVAVKIQYPGIGQTVREDFRTLSLFMLPGRLTKDWENAKQQMEDLCGRLEREADYQVEAAELAKARSLFREEDGVVVPQVYPELSTARVLTMERLEGVHLKEFLARNPTQEQRNEAARKVVRAWYRLLFAGRVLYLDFHPGNFLFMDDGRMGVLDFGMMLALDGELWELFRKMDRGLTTGKREDRIAALKEWCWLTDDPADADRVRLIDEFTEWQWRPRFCQGEFDFGDDAFFRRGVDLFVEMFKKRYSRARPCTPVISRQVFGLYSMLYRLKAKLDWRPLCEQEVKTAGWDRNEYT